jgi:hypothetical protein
VDVGCNRFCGFVVDDFVRKYVETGSLAYLYNYLNVSSLLVSGNVLSMYE